MASVSNKLLTPRFRSLTFSVCATNSIIWRTVLPFVLFRLFPTISCTLPQLFLYYSSSPYLESLIMSRLILTVQKLWRGVWWLRQMSGGEVSVVTVLLLPEYVHIMTRKYRWSFWGIVIGIRVSEIYSWMNSFYCLVLWSHYLSAARSLCTWRCCSGFGIWRSWANMMHIRIWRASACISSMCGHTARITN